MVLTQLTVKRFQRLRDLTVSFAPGLNVVRGPNESGKSTLRRALLAALFDNPTSASDEVKQQTTWGESEAYELKVAYQDRAGRPCTLRKDFAGQRIFLQVGEESFKTRSGVQERVREELGVESREAYALCASLDVRELEKLDARAAGRVGRQMLAGLLTGTGSGTDILQTLKRLDESLKELRKGLNSPSKTPGPLKEARERITRLQAEHAGLDQALETRRQRELKLAALDRQVAERQSRAQDLDRLIEANRRLAEARRREVEVRARDDRFDAETRRRRAAEEELSVLDRKLNADPAAGFTSEKISELQALSLARPLPPTPPAVSVPFWVWGGALALTGAVLAWRWPLPGVLAVLAGAGLGLIGWLRGRRAASEQRRARGEAEAQTAAARDRLQRVLDQAGVPDLETLVAHWTHVQADLARRELIARDLRDQAPPDEQEWKRVRSELRVLQDTLSDPDLLSVQVPPEVLNAREGERRALDAALNEDRGQRERLNALLEHDGSGGDRRQEVEEALASAQERLAYLESRARVGDLAMSFLEAARQQTVDPARVILESKAGEHLAVFTNGRYRRVSVVEEDLSSRVFVERTGRWEDPRVLSQGARDQFYLGLRLALTDILTGGRSVPLLLDDPFSAFDPERLRSALEWLRRTSRERQILLFTCRPEYDTVAERVIELTGAEERAPDPVPLPARGGTPDA